MSEEQVVEQQVTAESLDGSSQQPTEAEVSTAPQIDEETLNEEIGRAHV